MTSNRSGSPLPVRFPTAGSSSERLSNEELRFFHSVKWHALTGMVG